MKESISMGQIQATGNYPDAVPAKMLGGLNNGNKGNTTLKTYTCCYGIIMTPKYEKSLNTFHLTHYSNVCQCC